MACLQLTLQASFLNRPNIPLEHLWPSSQGPWAGVLPPCMPAVAVFLISVCESGQDFATAPLPLPLSRQGRPLSFLRHFVPMLKSPLHMPLAPAQPIIQARPCGPCRG